MIVLHEARDARNSIGEHFLRLVVGDSAFHAADRTSRLDGGAIRMVRVRTLRVAFRGRWWDDTPMTTIEQAARNPRGEPTWPDWKKASPGTPVEHVRSGMIGTFVRVSNPRSKNACAVVDWCNPRFGVVRGAVAAPAYDLRLRA